MKFLNLIHFLYYTTMWIFSLALFMYCIWKVSIGWDISTSFDQGVPYLALVLGATYLSEYSARKCKEIVDGEN